MKSRLILFIVFAFLMASTVFSQTTTQPPQHQTSSTPTSIDETMRTLKSESITPTWIANSSTCGEVENTQFMTFFYIGIILVLMAVLTYYLIAHIYSSNVLISKAKNEIYTILTHLSLAGLIILFISILSPLLLQSMSYINNDPMYQSRGSNGKTLIMSAIDISDYIVHHITSEYVILLVYNAKINSIYSATLWFGVTWMSTWQFNLGPALRPAIDAIGMALTFLSMSIVEWIIKGAFLCFLNKWGLFIVLFGAFLTTIPLTRNAGRIIFALLFAFLIIYPVMLILNYETYKLIITSPQLDNLSLLKLNSSGFDAIMFAAGFTILGSLSAPLWYFYTIHLINASISTSIMYVFLFSFFLPFLNITVTLTYANEVAKSFGLVTNFMQFMRLI